MRDIKRLGLFLIVGLASAGVNFFSFYIICSILGVGYIIASSTAYFLAVVTHFLGNRNITFKEACHADLTPQFKRYTVLLAINYLITLATLSVSVEVYHLSPYFGAVIAIVLTVSLGFLLSQRWVFNGKER